jgi:5'-nucleotidase
MNILLTNDDGIHHEGLWALYRRLRDQYNLSVVAPDRERSAIAHAITLHEPLRWSEVSVNGQQRGYAISGTPADCVKMGLLELVKPAPDMVISGINPGANVGVNVHYSGTVAAAREAALYGLPAFSVSIHSRQPTHLDAAVDYLAGMIDFIRQHPLPRGTFLNVNLPDLPLSRVGGVRVCAANTRFNGEYFEKRLDPRQGVYYWQGIDMQSGRGTDAVDGDACDTDWLHRNYITITPIHCDATHYGSLSVLGSLETMRLNDLEKA